MNECPKKRYGSRATAKKGAKRLKMTGERNVNVYLCGCGAWHVGHLPTAGRAMLKSRREQS
jgi:hypothetical protein